MGSGGNGRSPRRKARAAGPYARSTRRLLRPNRRERQLRRDAGLAPGGRAGYLKRGESFRHSSKSTVIFILPPTRLASQAALEEPKEPGSGRAVDPDGYCGRTAATRAARSWGGRLARLS